MAFLPPGFIIKTVEEWFSNLRELYSLLKSLWGRNLGRLFSYRRIMCVCVLGGGYFKMFQRSCQGLGDLGKTAENLQSSPRLGNSESSNATKPSFITGGTFRTFPGLLLSPQGHDPWIVLLYSPFPHPLKGVGELYINWEEGCDPPLFK